MGALFLSEQLRRHLAELEKACVLVFSDSHRQASPMRRFCRQHPDADLAIHLGDHDQDLDQLAKDMPMPLIAVAGNCDGPRGLLPRYLLLDICGVRVMAVHGHAQHVKLGLGQLAAYAAQTPFNAELVLFGHTHEQGIWTLDLHNRPVTLANPGSCATRPGPHPASAMKISFKQSDFSVDFLLDQLE